MRPVVGEPPPPPKNTAEIASSLVGARVTALFYVERIRGRPIADKLARMDVWRGFFEGTGVDPAAELERGFVAAPAANHPDETIVVAEHRLTPDRARAAVDVVIARSNPPGAWIAEQPVPEARVTLRGRTRVVALVPPRFLVVMPEAIAPMASRFVGTGGFPDPEGSECVVATALDPSTSLALTGAPPIPPTIQSARATITLGVDGSLDLALDATSATPDAALADAAYLTSAADRATSMTLGPLKIRILEPIPFRADGARVVGATHLTPGDVDRLLGLASALAAR